MKDQAAQADLLDELNALRQKVAQLQASQARHQQIEEKLCHQAQIIDQIHESVVSTDLEGYVTSWNAGAERLFGYTAAEALDQHISFIYPPDQHGFLEQGVIAPLKRKGNHETQVCLCTKSGENIYAHLALSLLKDETGQATGMIGYALDISQRKRTQEKLQAYRDHLEQLVQERTAELERANAHLEQEVAERRQAEAELEKERDFIDAVLHTIGALIIVLDQQGHIVQFNRTCEQLTGWSFEEIQGKRFWDILLPPEEIAAVKEIFEGLKREHLPNKHRNHWVTKDGDRRLIDWSNTVLPTKGDAVHYVIGTGIDITERIQAEEQLRFQAQLLDNVRESIVATDMEGNVIYWSKGAEALYGYRAEEVMHRPITFIVEPQEADQEEERMRQVREQGFWSGQYRQRRQDGSTFWSDTVISLVTDDQGQPYGLIGIDRDITERVQTEEALRRERDLLQRIMETSPAGITVVNRQGEITFANSQAEQVYELSKNEITSRTYNAPDWRITDYDGGPFPDEQLPFRRVIETGEPVYDVRHAVERPDGRRILLSINGAPLFDASGQVERVVFTFEDVTERIRAERALRRSEEKYRNLFEHANDAIFVIDLETHRILDANEKAAQRRGYTRQELLQLTIEDLQVPMDPERRQSIWQELRDKGSVIFEHAHQCQDGTTVPVQVSSWGTEYDNRHVAISLARDISERVRAEKARQKEMRALELLSGAPQAGITAESFGLLPLKQALPETFDQMVKHYQNLLELAMERRIYKIDQDPSEDLREVAEQLGLLRAGPRDVVEIHMTALKQKVDGLNALKAQAYADEGRLIVLELMGYLASYYRTRCTGPARQVSGAHRNKGGHRE